MKNCEVIWVIKDTSIAKTFVDGAAAHFFMSRIKLEKSDHDTFLTRTKYAVQETGFVMFCLMCVSFFMYNISMFVLCPYMCYIHYF